MPLPLRFAVVVCLAFSAFAQPAASVRSMSVGQQVTMQFAPPWTPSAVRYENAQELVILAPGEGQTLARVLVSIEPRTSFEDAVRRLAEIAAPHEEPARFFAIAGWPAVEVVFTQPLARRGQERGAAVGPPPRHQSAIVAVAIGASVVRFDVSLAPGVQADILRAALEMARTATFAARANPQETEGALQRMQALTKELKTTLRTMPSKGPKSDAAPGAESAAGGDAATATGASIRVQAGNGEAAVSTSANGANVVVATNSGLSFSTNRGNTFAPGTTGVFDISDPSLARGVSGNFYLATIATANGSAAHLGQTGCTNAISRSTDNGANFTLTGYSARCPLTGAGICFPDQEHIAADTVTAGNDQIYSVWRNFVPAAPAANCGQIGSGFVTPSITCSQNNGATWTARATIAGAGDFPRVAVGRDGTVYVVSITAASAVLLNRFTSCSAGLTAAAGFPTTVATLSGAVTCPVPGLDRCNDGNTLASPTVATDPNDANHLFVSFAERDGMGGERVVVRESFDRGATFSAPVTVSGGASARRFLPWACSTRGTAFVGWFDRGAAVGAASNDRTEYFVGGLRSRLWNLSNNPDPQCASGWPCGVRNANDSEACTFQPQLAGFCVNTSTGGGSGTRCDFSAGGCPAGETCQGGSGCPKYGDYNGVACAGDYVYTAWASATPPAGVTAAAGMNVFSSRVYVGAEGASIWRSTGTPCSGDSCQGWQRLDNNASTAAIAVGGGKLFQLHYDGAIWRYTGTPCEDPGRCTGWQRLDRNPKSVALAANDNDLFQLHSDGAIWRWTGAPCSGDSCTSWQRLDRNASTAAIAAAGTSLYQLHVGGRIFRWTGAPCSGDSCTSWSMLDNNSKTAAIAAGAGQLYQLHNDGMIFRWTGAGCSGETCTSWQRLDHNPKTVAIAADGAHLFQLHNDGWIWRYTGTPCSGDSCTGWQRLDHNAKAVAIAAGGGKLFQLHNDGWIWRWTGTPCSGDSCTGWQRLDNNARSGFIAATDSLYQLHTDPLYQLHDTGAIWRYTGNECMGNSCPGWSMLDNNPNTREIVAAGSQLFQRHADGKIWRSGGVPCTSDTSCPGWMMLDANPNTAGIAAGGTQLYQRHSGGSIWRHTGVPCTSATSCPGWMMLDNNPRSTAIATAGNQLYQLHSDGKIWRWTGVGCTSPTSCPGWQMLDANPNTAAIVTAGNQLFQRHNDGKIWRWTGVGCTSATSCPGWQMLDQNPSTTTITAAGNQLFQLHADGKVWRWTGVPCTSATSCPGWQMLDSNPRTRQIAGSSTHLYQRHDDGAIWRYSGPPCSSATNCPGWQRLDNNPRTRAIAAGGF